MKRPDSLKEIERKAYRSTFDDGIYDIAFGLAFLILGWVGSLNYVSIPKIYGYTLLLLLPIIAFFCKRLISTPRLGAVEFGMKRRSKKRFWIVISLAILFLQMPLLGMFSKTSAIGIMGGTLIAPVLPAMIIGPLLIIGAYLIDYPRMYIYAAVLFVAGPHASVLGEFVEYPVNLLVGFGLPGLAILIYGLVLLSQFIKKYPLPSPEVNHVG